MDKNSKPPAPGMPTIAGVDRLVAEHFGDPPAEGARVLSGGPAQVGDRVAYRDSSIWVHAWYIAQLGDVAYCAVVGMPQLVPLPAAQLAVLERGALVRRIMAS